MPTLLAVPNVSEGRDRALIEALEGAFSAGEPGCSTATSTPITIALCSPSPPGPASPAAPRLADSLLAGADAAIEAIDMSTYAGLHPAIGALDVCPLVWLDPGDRDAAGSAAGDVGERIGALGVPVFLYGELAATPERRERAYFRNGGLAELWLRMESGELRPDHGPDEPHPSAGATLVTARPPLAAFNVELDSGDVEVARAVAAGLRESGGGLPGVRAIGLRLSRRPRPRSPPTSTTLWARRSLSSSSGCGSWPRRSAPGRSRRSWSASSRRRPWSAIPRTCRFAASTRRGTRSSGAWPSRRRFEPVAQTKKKRRRKHKGTQGGRIDTKRRSRPRSRQEAKAQARSRSSGGKAAAKSTPRRPGEARSNRGLVAAAIFFVAAAGRSSNARSAPSLGLGAFMLIFYIPAGYYIDTMMWRKRERAPAARRAAES